MTPRLPLQTLLFAEAAPRLKRRALVFDYFAGAGGASTGIEQALGRSPDVAINHCANAVACHKLNHPSTDHIQVDAWDVDPERHLPPGDVWFVWVSPDCTHFSRAKGGRPVKKKIRGLAWITLRLAGRRLPQVLTLENVVEFRTWGPLRRGRPIKSKAGQTFRKFIAQLEALGYQVEHRVLDAADFGAPTHRRRLILIARRDGQPIVWPEPTHGPGRAHPYRTAAECLDFSLPCPSIFERKRPLAEATMRRIAEGLRRFVLTNPKPFLVQVNHGRDVNRSRGLDEPMPTITSHHGFGLVTPWFVRIGNGEREGQSPRVEDVQRPLGTIVAQGRKQGLIVAFLAKHYGGVVGHTPDRPLGTVTAVDHHSVVAVHLTKFFGTSTGAPVDAPAPTITGQGQHVGLVAAFLVKYYGQGTAQSLGEPLHTIVSKARFGLVTVEIDGESYALVDIGLRMLTPRELARCQGFDDSFQLVGTQAEQVARVGNSVSPPLARAVVAALFPEAVDTLRRAAE